MLSHDACCAPKCSNGRDPHDSSLKFHRIPADHDRKERQIWIARINRADLREKDISPSTRLCSEHFLTAERQKTNLIPCILGRGHILWPGKLRENGRPTVYSSLGCLKRKRLPRDVSSGNSLSQCMYSSAEREAANALLLLNFQYFWYGIKK